MTLCGRRGVEANTDPSWAPRSASTTVVAAKLGPPAPRPGTVVRAPLVDRLLAAERVPVVAVVAPPGYGKTTLLAQWAERTRCQVAWVGLDPGDDDPAVLLAHLLAALGGAEPEAEAGSRGAPLHGPPTGVDGAALATAIVSRVVPALSPAGPPVALVLDQAELLGNPLCRRAVADLAPRLPAGSRLLVASRDAPPLPLARLRSQGQVVELDAGDLAMDAEEAAALVEATGLGLGGDDAAHLIGRSEGWPVGLFLGAAAVASGGRRNGASAPAAGRAATGDAPAGDAATGAGAAAASGAGRNGAGHHGARDDGARDDGARDDGARDDGARDDGARHDGARHDGARHDGARHDGARHDGARHDGARDDGPRDDGARRHGAGEAGHPGPGSLGDDHLLADYFRSEVLARLPAPQVAFLRRTAVLDRLSAPLCDAVLAATGSGRILDALAHGGAFLVPLDRRREWYRHHRLFGDLLRAELARLEPELAPDLHARAAAWCEANGRRDEAVDHARAAGDADRAARVVADLALAAPPGWRAPVSRGWLRWFDEQGGLERHPAIAALGAWHEALAGQPVAAERWAAAAERGSPGGVPPGTDPAGGWVPLVRAVLCRGGPARMQVDAAQARDRLAAHGEWHALALVLGGLAHLVAGEAARADAVLAQAAERAQHAGDPLTGSLALAERAVLATWRHDWTAADTLAERARTLAGAGRVDDCGPVAVVHAVAGRTAQRRGDAVGAADDLAAAARLAPLLTDAMPALAVQVRLELAWAQLERTDVAAARDALREARDLLGLRPDLGVLARRADELGAKLDTIRQGRIAATSLTPAELRLLPLLSTHLTFREIGERLHVSRHTVKTQAISVYRKLGASSRSEAIARVLEVGLLGP